MQQLEDENGEMTLNVCRLKSQTEKLDQVSAPLQRASVMFCRFTREQGTTSMNKEVVPLRKEKNHNGLMDYLKLVMSCVVRRHSPFLPTLPG